MVVTHIGINESNIPSGCKECCFAYVGVMWCGVDMCVPPYQ